MLVFLYCVQIVKNFYYKAAFHPRLADYARPDPARRRGWPYPTPRQGDPTLSPPLYMVTYPLIEGPSPTRTSIGMQLDGL